MLGTVTSSHGLCMPSPASLDCALGMLAPGDDRDRRRVGHDLGPTPADNTASGSVKVQPTDSVDDVTVSEPQGVFPRPVGTIDEP